MRHWVVSFFFVGCSSKGVVTPALFSVGDFEVHWSEGAFSIETDAGVPVFTAPSDGPLLTLRRSEVEVEYGSGSFTFDESSPRGVTPTP
jgi:hypothetical protein